MKPNSGRHSEATSSDPNNSNDLTPSQNALQDADLDMLSAENWSPERENNDPVWNLLGEASKQEPSAFFARNVVRDARLMENTASPSWGARLAAFFSPTKLTIAAAACVCALAVYQMWPAPSTVIQRLPSSPRPSSHPLRSLSL